MGEELCRTKVVTVEEKCNTNVLMWQPAQTCREWVRWKREPEEQVDEKTTL